MKKIITFIITTTIALSIISCKKTVSMYSGKVTNVSNQPVNDAKIILIALNSKKQYEVKTNQVGEYSVENIKEGKYLAIISKDGYIPLNESIELTKNLTSSFNLKGAANIMGKVIDSQTGLGFNGAKVSFTSNLSATSSANAELVTYTNASGDYEIKNAPFGKFTCFIESPTGQNYFIRKVENVEFKMGTNVTTSMPDLTLVSAPSANQYRIILNWGANPDDLDAHLTGPISGTSDRFHVYFVDQNSDNADLDVDDVTSFGPETVTIRNFVNGIYKYSVHNYSNQDSDGGAEMISSPTTVEIYNSNGLIRSFNPPPFVVGSGNTWRVFEINYNNNNPTINAINTYEYAYSEDDTNVFKTTNSKKKAIKFKPNSF